MVNSKPRLKINPKTGLPRGVYRVKGAYRFQIQVDNRTYATVAYKSPYEAAYKAHTSDWYLTCGSNR